MHLRSLKKIEKINYLKKYSDMIIIKKSPNMINQSTYKTNITLDAETITVTSDDGKYYISVADLIQLIGPFKHCILKSHIAGELITGACQLSTEYIDGNMDLHIKFFDANCPTAFSKEDVIRLVKMNDPVDEIREKIREELHLENEKLIKELNDKITKLENIIACPPIRKNSIITTNSMGIEKIFILNEEDTEFEFLVEDDITSIKINGFENLLSLNLSCKNLKIISGFETLSRLTNINLYSNEIEKIEGLDKLTNLRCLDLSNNKISKLENLDKLTKLEELYCWRNHISVIENLDKLTNLMSLDLSNNEITKLENLDKLTRLEEFQCWINHISVIENLDELSNLKVLNLNDNLITKISGLGNCKQLRKIHLNSNHISVIENLEGLDELSCLHLINNKITEVPNLNHLKKLESVYLIGNLIVKRNYSIHY